MSTHLTHWDSIFLAWATRMMRLSIFVYEKKKILLAFLVFLSILVLLLVQPNVLCCLLYNTNFFSICLQQLEVEEGCSNYLPGSVGAGELPSHCSSSRRRHFKRSVRPCHRVNQECLSFESQLLQTPNHPH